MQFVLIEKKLKILIVVTEFPSVSETFILNQIVDLIDNGHQIKIFSYNEPSEKIVHQIVKDYNLHELVFTHFKNRKSKINRIKGAISFLKKYYRDLDFYSIFQLFNLCKWKKNILKAKIYYDFPLFLLKEKYDIIHCHFGFNGVKISRAYKLGLSIASKKVVSFHGSDLIPSKIEDYKIVYKDIFEVFEAITVNTPYLENIIRSICPNIKSLHILPVGFCTEYINSIDSVLFDDEYFNIVFCGRLIPLKGPDKAIEIIVKLIETGHKKVRLHLIGSGEMLHDLINKVNSLHLQDNIIFYGSLTQKKVYKIMASSNVFIYTGRVDEKSGRAETQGLVIQEAQFLKLPVVISNVGGVKYGMIENETGFLLDPDDIVTFVEKLIELKNHPRKRIEMGKKGNEYVKEKFSSKYLGILLLKIYES